VPHARAARLLPLATVVERAAVSPARVHDYPRKGKVAEGFDADLVLVDPDERRVVRGAEHLSKAKQTPYEGLELWGWPRLTMVMGTAAYRSG
jgi:dihydroorotase-like cyclic amidohydrolase